MDLETNAAGKQEILASGSQGKPIVARTWFGRTRREQADEYLKYNYENGVLEVEKVEAGAGRAPGLRRREQRWLRQLTSAAL